MRWFLYFCFDFWSGSFDQLYNYSVNIYFDYYYYNFVCNSLSRDWTNLALSLTLSFHGERSRTWTLTGRTITWNRRDQQRPFPHRTHFYRSRPMWEASGKGNADDVIHRQTDTDIHTPTQTRKLRYIIIHMCRHGLLRRRTRTKVRIFECGKFHCTVEILYILKG